VPVMNISEPGGLTLSAAPRATSSASNRRSVRPRRLLRRHFEGRPVAGRASGDHHVVDRGREIVEERPQGRRIVGVEGRAALRAKLERRLLEAFGVAPGEDNAGALGAGSPVSSPMPELPPMTTTVWPSNSGSRWVTAVVAVVM